MNKSEFVAAVAESASLSKADAERAVDAFINTVSNQLKTGGEVRLVGFGTFEVRNRDASEGRNPRTGETIKIKASKLPRFKAGKALKDEVNGVVGKK
ncbi:MAG: HU family DNA-binding protein [Alphaproteobacteria bacterium]|nr:HU family DNA-binding protein [Alphaproteobacteria bacterium]